MQTENSSSSGQLVRKNSPEILGTQPGGRNHNNKLKIRSWLFHIFSLYTINCTYTFWISFTNIFHNISIQSTSVTQDWTTDQEHWISESNNKRCCTIHINQTINKKKQNLLVKTEIENRTQIMNLVSTKKKLLYIILHTQGKIKLSKSIMLTACSSDLAKIEVSGGGK